MKGYYFTDTIIFALRPGVNYETHGWGYTVYFYHIDHGVYLDQILREMWS